MRILVVDEDKTLTDEVSESLKSNGHELTCVYDGFEAFDLLSNKKFDLVLLEVILPKISGIEVLERIRKNKVLTPVIIITALNSEEDKIKGLDAGANDYVTKPFSLKELLARVRVYERKSEGNIIKPEILRFKNTKLDTSTYEVSTDLKAIRLSAKELKLLKYFMERPKKVISKEKLYQQIWGEEKTSSNSVEVYITFLRNKLFNIQSDIEIFAIRTVGYRME